MAGYQQPTLWWKGFQEEQIHFKSGMKEWRHNQWWKGECWSDEMQVESMVWMTWLLYTQTAGAQRICAVFPRRVKVAYKKGHCYVLKNISRYHLWAPRVCRPLQLQGLQGLHCCAYIHYLAMAKGSDKCVMITTVVYQWHDCTLATSINIA